MSIGDSPSLKTIADLIGDIAPHSMSEMYGINFGGGSSSPASGTISLSVFRNQVIQLTPTEWLEQAKIMASDGQGGSKGLGDRFGKSVSISGDGNTAIVGSWLEDTGGTNAGAAYIFIRSGTSWSEQAKIQASDKALDDNFGKSVAISSNGNTAIVGAEFEDTMGIDAGAAYILAFT